jgi:hypothetical protein
LQKYFSCLAAVQADGPAWEYFQLFIFRPLFQTFKGSNVRVSGRFLNAEKAPPPPGFEPSASHKNRIRKIGCFSLQSCYDLRSYFREVLVAWELIFAKWW